MTTYKGNAGHLMQHWPLCEMLRIAATHKDVTGLNFIDAYAMAPLATKKVGKDAKFQRAEDRLPALGDSASAYEKAWYKLTSGHCPALKGYPNSAAFVEQVWKGDFSMLLCEIKKETRAEIKPWLQRVRESEKCEGTDLFCGNWRERFKKGLPSPADVGLSNGSLTLLLFDPNKYVPCKNDDKPLPPRLYPEDLEMAVQALESLEGGILIQLSTYSVKGTTKEIVESSVHQILASNGFKQVAVVHASKNMMSLVYAHNVSWAAELADVLGGFDKWFSAI